MERLSRNRLRQLREQGNAFDEVAYIDELLGRRTWVAICQRYTAIIEKTQAGAAVS